MKICFCSDVCESSKLGFPVVDWREAFISKMFLCEAVLSVPVDPGFLDKDDVDTVLMCEG